MAEAAQIYKPIKDCSSHSFFEKFKSEIRVSSRRVTKFVTKASVVNEEELKQQAITFTTEFNEFCNINSITDSQVWNSDQSKFEYEMCYDRTYDFVGAKHVPAVVVDKNAMTHSYTIMVHISKAGKLGSRLYLCFQEVKGAFGPKVLQAVEETVSSVANSVVVEASTSGKMTKRHVDSWTQACFEPEIGATGDTYLLLDAWGGHKHVETQTQDDDLEMTTEPQKFQVKLLPKGTTK